MQEKLIQLQAKFEADETLVEKMFNMEEPEGVQSLLKEQGLQFTLEEITALRDELVKYVEKVENGELSDESLEGVAGGVMIAPGIIPGILPGIMLPGRPFPGGPGQFPPRGRW